MASETAFAHDLPRMFDVATSTVVATEGRPRWSMVVVTPVDCLLDPESPELGLAVRQAARLLAEFDIPIVLVSTRPPLELAHIQRELDIVAPFVSNGGAAVHIPPDYFAMWRPSPEKTIGQVIDFGAPDLVPDAPLHGLQALLDLYRSHRPDIVVIGFSRTWSDRLLLEHVDVPVIIRSRHIDHRQLQHAFPDALMTIAEGPLGWAEAILGEEQIR